MNVEHVRPELDLIDLAREVICQLLPLGAASKLRVAGELSLHERTFARRLQRYGYTYRSLLDDIRRELSTEYLASGKSVDETSDLLGFADRISFHRAFRRWTGTTPRRYPVVN